MTNNINTVVEVVASWGGNPLDSVQVTGSGLSIGPSGASWLTLPQSLLARDVTLVERVDGAWVLTAPGASELVLSEGLEAVAFGGYRRVRLVDGASAEVRIGDFVFFVRSTERVAAPRGPVGSLRWTRWLGVAALLHVFVLAMFALTPPNVSALNAENMRSQDRYLSIALPTSAQPTPPEPVLPAGPDGGSRSDSAGSMGGGEATAASDGASPAQARPHGARNPRPSFVVTQENVNRLGALAVLTADAMSFGDGASPFIVGSGHEGDGGLAESARSLALPRGPGYGALDLHGAGVGTCDPRTQNCGRGIVGVGQLETHGDPGHGRTPSLGERHSRVPTVFTPAPTTTTGGLSREQVRLTIRRHVSEVRFCYEQALQARPDLEGRVAVRFIVGADGRVQGANVASNSVSDRVGSCVQQAVTRWTFPSSSMPTGVTYPFVMQSGS